MIKYQIKKRRLPVLVDADWNKPFWRDIDVATVNVAHWKSTRVSILPETEVKLQYDEDNLYVIFRVQDYYVRAAETQIHGDVWKDSCVELFFAPCSEKSNSYFNLEINCCGVLLAQYHEGPRQNSCFLEIEDCQKIKIAGTASGPIRHEIHKPLTWTLEYAVPFEILKRYTHIEKAAPGVLWSGNFYKCADDSSCPHWMSWAPISGKTLDFHRPDCFGILEFV